MTANDWLADALCAEVDTDLFFSVNGVFNSEARSICARCPVSADCLAVALKRRERYGVWGGLSEFARRPLLAALDFAATVKTEDVEVDLCGTYPKGFKRHRSRGEEPCLDCRLAYNAYQRARAVIRAGAVAS